MHACSPHRQHITWTMVHAMIFSFGTMTGAQSASHHFCHSSLSCQRLLTVFWQPQLILVVRLHWILEVKVQCSCDYVICFILWYVSTVYWWWGWWWVCGSYPWWISFVYWLTENWMVMSSKGVYKVLHLTFGHSGFASGWHMCTQQCTVTLTFK